MSLSHALPRERVAPLGRAPDAESRPLVAIVSEPQIQTPLPAVLLVNAGVIHRVGPHRLHVRLARRLAAAGHLALRMDLSGIGDSGPLPDRLDFRSSAVADVRTAVHHLTSEEAVDSIIVFGICSGADNALAAAAVEPRIGGLVLIDPPAYATVQSRRRALAARARDPRAWASLPSKVLSRLRRDSEEEPQGAGDPNAAQNGRRPPPEADYGRQLQALAERGVRVLAVYTAAQGVRYNHADQLFEAFPALRGRIDVRYFADANHTFTELAQQAALIDAVVGWCGEHIPA